MFKRTLVGIACSLCLYGTLATDAFADDGKASQHYEDALNAFNQDDFKAAYIHLKNSLQEAEDNLPAKILMGRVLMISGYLEEAETELEEALQAGADPNLVISHLGKIWLFQKKYAEIYDHNFRGLNTESRIAWLQVRATAYLNESKIREARKDYLAALQLAPTNTRTLNALANLELFSKDIPAAKKYSDQSIALDSQQSTSWRIRGQILQAQNKLDDAIVAYERGFEVDQEDPVLTRNLVNAYVAKNDMAKASDTIEKILKLTPNDPMATLLKGWMLAEERKDEDASRELEKLSANLATIDEAALNDDPTLLYVSALSAYAQNNFEQARTFLYQYLTLRPDNIEASTLYAQTLLKIGEHKQALQALIRHEKALPNDLDTAILLGKLYLANNKAFKTVELIGRLKRAFPGNKRVELLEIKTMIARGRFKQANRMLSESAHINSDLSFVLARAMLMLETGELEEANNVADQLLSLSDNVDFLNFKAGVLIKMRRWAEAETTLNSVLAQRPDHFAARYNMATILGAQEKHQQAFEVAAELKSLRPGDLDTKLLYARTLIDTRQLDEALVELESAIEIDLDNVSAGEMLVAVYLRTREYDKAVRALSDLIKRVPDEPRYQLQRTELYIARNQTDRAIREFQKIRKQIHDQPAYLLQLGQLQLRANQQDLAVDSIHAAYQIRPQDPYFAIEYIRILLNTGQLETANEAFAAFSGDRELSPQLELLKGDLHSAARRWEEAAKAYAAALEKAPNYRIASAKLYQLTQRNVGLESFANSILNILQANPDSAFHLNLLADFYLNQGQTDEAKARYEQLLNIEGLKNRAFVYNNLANIYLTSNIGYAEELINKALSEGQEHAAILDTQGWIQSLKGRHEEALTILRRAHAMDSTEPAIRYHIAFTLHKLGRNDEARNELRLALASERSFAERAKAEALLATI